MNRDKSTCFEKNILPLGIVSMETSLPVRDGTPGVKTIGIGMSERVVNRDVRDQNRDRKKNYRDRGQRLNPRLYDGLNSVNFCTSEVTLFEKKGRKVLVVN
jgi:hypothetical protein